MQETTILEGRCENGSFMKKTVFSLAQSIQVRQSYESYTGFGDDQYSQHKNPKILWCHIVGICFIVCRGNCNIDTYNTQFWPYSFDRTIPVSSREVGRSTIFNWPR
jgi:hypothetical protein